jgi:hypothetical protein
MQFPVIITACAPVTVSPTLDENPLSRWKYAVTGAPLIVIKAKPAAPPKIMIAIITKRKKGNPIKYKRKQRTKKGARGPRRDHAERNATEQVCRKGNEKAT